MINILKGGDSSLPSENDDVDDFLSFVEKLERGRSPRSKMRHPEERKRRGISINGGGICPPPTLPIKDLKSFLGLVGKGDFTPSQ